MRSPKLEANPLSYSHHAREVPTCNRRGNHEANDDVLDNAVVYLFT